MNRLARWLTGIAVLFCVLFLGLTQVVLPDLLQQAGPYAEKLAADYVNGTVQLGAVTWPGSNTILVKDIVVRDQKQQTIATAPEVRIAINPFKGFSGLEKAVSEINLERPTVYIKQDKDEKSTDKDKDTTAKDEIEESEEFEEGEEEEDDEADDEEMAQVDSIIDKLLSVKG